MNNVNNAIASVAKLHQAVTAAIYNSTSPLCAKDLYENFPEVSRLAPNVDKVSNTLSYLFKRGLLDRMPFSHAKSPAVRFAYTLGTEPLPQTPRAKAPRKSRTNTVEMTLSVKLNGSVQNVSLDEARKLRDSLNGFFRGLK